MEKSYNKVEALTLHSSYTKFTFRVKRMLIEFKVNCEEPCATAPPCRVLNGGLDHERKMATLMCMVADPQCEFEYRVTIPGSDSIYKFEK